MVLVQTALSAPYLGGGTVDVAATCNTAGYTLSGTTTASVSAVTGKATFADLSLDKVATSCTLTFSFAGLSDLDSSAFAISAGEAVSMEFTVQPTSVASDTSISPSVEVTLYDAGGNVATGETGTVQVVLTSGTGALSGTLSRSVASGVATFDDLSIDLASGGKVLQATTAIGTVSPVSSASFTVAPGSPDRVEFVNQPGGGVAGAAWSSPGNQPSVRLVDAAGNLVSGSGATVSLVVTGGETLLGTTSGASLSTGTAAFSDLYMNAAGTYTLETATAGASVTEATSAGFNVVPGAPFQLAWDMPSTTTTGGVALAAFTVTIQDEQGNTVDTDENVGLTLSATPAAGGGAMSGSISVAAAAGVTTFSDISLDVASAGPEYTILATSASSALTATAARDGRCRSGGGAGL